MDMKTCQPQSLDIINHFVWFFFEVLEKIFKAFNVLNTVQTLRFTSIDAHPKYFEYLLQNFEKLLHIK